jgi:hypothetical protein
LLVFWSTKVYRRRPVILSSYLVKALKTGVTKYMGQQINKHELDNSYSVTF